MDGRMSRFLDIIDKFNRESLSIDVNTSLPCQRLIRVLEKLVAKK